jgi:hypothetical protein
MGLVSSSNHSLKPAIAGCTVYLSITTKSRTTVPISAVHRCCKILQMKCLWLLLLLTQPMAAAAAVTWAHVFACAGET